MNDNQELSLIAEQFRTIAASIENDWRDSRALLRHQERAGNLIIRAFELGRLDDLQGLDKLVDGVKSPPTQPEGIRAWRLPCRSNLFIDVCGYTDVIIIVPKRGEKAEVIRNNHGGLLPTTFPSTFPDWDVTQSRDPQHRARHEASICRWLAAWIERPEAAKTKKGANTSVVFSGVEPTPDVKDLCFKLAKRGNLSEKQVAREFTSQDEGKAESLLAQIRRLKRAGRIQFVYE